MQTISEQTIGQIAAKHPAAERIFETLGIDYCCGGKRSLSAACADAKVPVETVIGLLESSEEIPHPGVPNDAPLGELTLHIVETHHGFVRRESPRIQALLTKVSDKHGPVHPELLELKTLFVALAEELAEHMMKEERILFPYIAALEGAAEPSACFGSVESPISVMVADHENAGATLSKMRVLTDGYQAPDDACAGFQALYRALEEFERDLHSHVHLENNVLFPRAMAEQRARRTTTAQAK